MKVAEALSSGMPWEAVGARPTADGRAAGRSPAGFKERTYRIVAAVWLVELVAAAAAICAGLGARAWERGTGDAFVAALRDVRSPAVLWTLAGAALFSWLLVAMRTYEVRNIYRLHVWVKNLVKALALWLVISLAFVGLIKSLDFAPRAGLFYCVAALFAVQLVVRLCLYALLMQPLVREAASRHIIVVGWNEKAAHLRLALRRDASQLATIIGCVRGADGGFAVKPSPEVPLLGGYNDLDRVMRECGANAVVLADAACPALEIERLAAYCQRELISFQMVPAFFPALGSGLSVENVSGVPLLGVTRLPLDLTVNRIAKRALDIVGALVGLALAAPIVVVFAGLVYRESPGPVIFRQRRTSRSGRHFDIYKIRSMRIDAEEGTGAVWCKADDARRLKIGAFMRRWNIDELPQFVNVLKGDMSLVGPRPERPELIERFKDQIPNYNARHEVRAGLTGWAQIHGYRGDTDLGRRIEHDLYYLENWSLLLDLYCVVATLFRTRNAY